MPTRFSLSRIVHAITSAFMSNENPNAYSLYPDASVTSNGTLWAGRALGEDIVVTSASKLRRVRHCKAQSGMRHEFVLLDVEIPHDRPIRTTLGSDRMPSSSLIPNENLGSSSNPSTRTRTAFFTYNTWPPLVRVQEKRAKKKIIPRPGYIDVDPHAFRRPLVFFHTTRTARHVHCEPK